MVNVKKHLKIDYQLHKFLSVDDTLSKQYSPPTTYKCYMEEELKTVVNDAGEEVVSDRTLYADGSVEIVSDDLIEFEGNKYPIKALSNIRTKKGKIVLRVVYM